MRIPFVKMSGSGNDFVVVDNRRGPYIAEVDKSRFVRSVCGRRTGIGADGALFVEDSETADFKMRYFNSDGGEVEFCGNGARCISHFAYHSLGMKSPMMFDSLAGLIRADVAGDHVRVLMPSASEISKPKIINVHDTDWEYFFINTGVPHTVIVVDDLEKIPVVEVGRAIRFSERFAPDGTNVDFLRAVKNEECDIEIRTYERGVEDETLACGTGAVACALVADKIGIAKLPMRVRVALPDILEIGIGEENKPTLNGLVKKVFEGTLNFQ